MSEQTLVARRMIKDHICSVGGLTNVIVTQDLLNSAQGSRQKYILHLELKSIHWILLYSYSFLKNTAHLVIDFPYQTT
jgi:hypothetical protein